jgi:sporadic carbohydrate cluster 2OG-Fe(II) oxygenase
MLKWTEPSPAAREFVKNGMCIVPVSDSGALATMRSRAVAFFRKSVQGGDGLDDEAYLNSLHKFVDPAALNGIRVALHKEVGADEAFRRAAFESVRTHLTDIVGNELVMQRMVNFVIQMPKDPTSLLYIHTDAWSGCSPYEVVLWMPLVNVFETKSMYICRKERNLAHMRSLKKDFDPASADQLLERVRPDLEYLKMDFGKALLFSSTLIHGAEVNRTDETRVILNVRFKSLFSPYGTKALGETFVPVNYLPATEVGLSYDQEFDMVRG